MASNRYDIALLDNEPIFENGDFKIDVSDQQHVQDTIVAFPSWWKQYPEEGVGIRSWLGAPLSTQEVSRIIRLQLQNDGYVVNNPVVKFDAAGNLTIQPNATI